MVPVVSCCFDEANICFVENICKFPSDKAIAGMYMYVYKPRISDMFVDLSNEPTSETKTDWCWKFAVNWSVTFCGNCSTIASPCVTTSGPHASCANLFRHHQSGRFERENAEAPKAICSLSYMDAEPEEVFFGYPILFLRWHFHTVRETLTKGESEWNEHFVKSRAYEQWQRWTLRTVFSESVKEL